MRPSSRAARRTRSRAARGRSRRRRRGRAPRRRAARGCWLTTEPTTSTARIVRLIANTATRRPRWAAAAEPCVWGIRRGVAPAQDDRDAGGPRRQYARGLDAQGADRAIAACGRPRRCFAERAAHPDARDSSRRQSSTTDPPVARVSRAEGRHAEHPVQAMSGAGPVYIRAVANTCVMPRRATSARAAAFGSGMSRIHGSAQRDPGEQGVEDRLGARDVIREQRPDLPAPVAATDHAVPAERAVLRRQRPGVGIRLPDPRLEERSTGRREARPIHGLDRLDRDRPGVDGRVVARRRGVAVGPARAVRLVPRIPVREHATDPLVDLDVLEHAIAALDTPIQPPPRGLVDRQPVAAAAERLAHDVAAEEREVVAVPDAADRRDGLAVELPDEEALGIGDMERRGVVEAGVPARLGHPGDRDRGEVGDGGGPDAEAAAGEVAGGGRRRVQHAHSVHRRTRRRRVSDDAP